MKLSVMSASMIIAMLTLPGITYSFPLAEPGSEGTEILVSMPGPVIATFQGQSASYSSDLYLELNSNGTPGLDGNHDNDLFLFNNQNSEPGATVNMGSFPVGTRLIFRLHVHDTGNDFYSGPARRNPDTLPHARVQSFWTSNEALVSFEDLFGRLDDYNDLSFSFTGVKSSDISVVKAWIAPQKVRQGDTLHLSAQISGDSSRISRVSFIVGGEEVATFTDEDGDSTWEASYVVNKLPGYVSSMRINVYDNRGKIVSRWPGFTVIR